MKKILIINLRRLGDVYSTAHLVNSMTTQEDVLVSLLVYKESARAAHGIKGLTNVFEIDRKDIITLKTNKLFSDNFAFEQLYLQLEAASGENWDQIINYSNDTVGAYLTSYLKDSSKHIVGVHYNNERNLVSKNDWELVFNNVLPQVKISPIHFVDCYHQMCGIPVVTEGFKLNSNPRHNEAAFLKFQELRQTHGYNLGQSRIVGIQLKSSTEFKDIPGNVLHQLINLIKKNQELIPCLLIAPNDQEREIAHEFNSHHNNELVIVEADLSALVSVLMNVDLLVTPDTSVKHIANLAETPIIEVSIGSSPFLKQGSYAKDSLILTDLISTRNFGKNNSKTLTTKITAHDILATVLYSFSGSKTIKPLVTEGVTLYQASFDEKGINYSAIAGTVQTSSELQRLVGRQLIFSILEDAYDTQGNLELAGLNRNEANFWVTNEKNELTLIMKDILGTLRSLLQCSENQKSTKEFVTNLGKLLSYADAHSLVQIPAIMFKAKIEGINAKTFEENIKEVESLLYELKSDLQKTLQCLLHVEMQLNASKVEDMVHRVHESIRG